jgi:hypothetical protein
MVKRIYKEPKDETAWEKFKKASDPVSGYIWDKVDLISDEIDKVTSFLPREEIELFIGPCDFGILRTGIWGSTRTKLPSLMYRNPECVPPPTPPKSSKDWFSDLDLSGCQGEWWYSIIIPSKLTRISDTPLLFKRESVSIPEILRVVRGSADYSNKSDEQILNENYDGPGEITYLNYAAVYRLFGWSYRLNAKNEYIDTYSREVVLGYDATLARIGVLNTPRTGAVMLDELKEFFEDKYEIHIYDIDPPSPNANCEIRKNPPPITYPPPPPPPMSCCPNTRANDELMRLILKRIGTPQTVTIFDEDMEREGAQKADKKQETLFNAAKINTDRIEIANRLIGIESYPITAPETIIKAHKEGIFEKIFDFFDGEKEIKLKSLTELTTWMAQQDNAVLGQFHQVLEFEQDFDGDGKAVTEQVVLPNVAETLKEIILLLVQLANGEGTKVHALVKILAEVNNLKVNLFKTMQTVIDIQDYLDYPTNTKQVTVPLSCNLKLNEKGDDIEDFFSDSTGLMTFEDWDGSNSLHDNMLDLMQIAAMLRSTMYQRD